MQLRVEVPLPRGAEMVMLDNARQLRPVLGLTDAVRAMVPVNEPVPVAVIVDVPAAFALTVTLVGFAARVKPPVG